MGNRIWKIIWLLSSSLKEFQHLNFFKKIFLSYSSSIFSSLPSTLEIVWIKHLSEVFLRWQHTTHVACVLFGWPIRLHVSLAVWRVPGRRQLKLREQRGDLWNGRGHPFGNGREVVVLAEPVERAVSMLGEPPGPGTDSPGLHSRFPRWSHSHRWPLQKHQGPQPPTQGMPVPDPGRESVCCCTMPSGVPRHPALVLISHTHLWLFSLASGLFCG